MSRSSVTALRVIASAGKHRVAIVNDAAAPGLVDSKNEPPDTIGAGYIDTGNTPLPLYPDTLTSPYAPPWDPSSSSPPTWAADVGKARLAATLIDNDRRVALLELPDGSWQSLTNINQNYYSDFQYTIGSGRLWYYLRQNSGTPVEGSLILQEK